MRRPRRSTAIGTLEELARSPGIGSEGVLATLEALGALAGVEGGGFCPTDAAGDTTGHIGDELFSATTAAKYFHCYHDRLEEEEIGPTCRFLMSRGVGVFASAQHRAGWRRTQMFEDIFRPTNVAHMARVSVRRGLRPLGTFFLLRTASAPDFSAKDLSCFTQLQGLLSRIAERVPQPPPAEAARLADGEANWVVDRRGRIELSSFNALRLAEQAYGIASPLGGWPIVERWLRTVFVGLWREAQAGRSPRTLIANVHGSFEFLGTQLGGARAGGAKRMLVQLQRHVSVRARLFLSPRFRALPRREKQVVLGIVEGATTQLIAQELGVARTTAITWIRSLYARFDVQQRGALVKLLLADAAPLPS